MSVLMLFDPPSAALPCLAQLGTMPDTDDVCSRSTILWMHNPSLMHSRSEIVDGEVRLHAMLLSLLSSCAVLSVCCQYP